MVIRSCVISFDFCRFADKSGSFDIWRAIRASAHARGCSAKVVCTVVCCVCVCVSFALEIQEYLA